LASDVLLALLLYLRISGTLPLSIPLVKLLEHAVNITWASAASCMWTGPAHSQPVSTGGSTQGADVPLTCVAFLLALHISLIVKPLLPGQVALEQATCTLWCDSPCRLGR
jgi:hypothetical protein